jgi:hypothetical protein
MPNFTLGVSGAGLTIEVWDDPIVGQLPSRLNAAVAHRHLYHQILQGVGPITVTATVNGTAGPLDAVLAGETFMSAFAEVPLWPAPAISSPAGQSSVASFTPTRLGLNLFVMRRINGGAVGVPFYVVEAV